MRLSSWTLLLLWFQIYVSSFSATEAFASKPAKNNPKKGGGFGGSNSSNKSKPKSKNKSKTKNTPASYTPDKSPEIQDLLSFLEENECEGVGIEGGTEIGYHPTTNIRGLFAADTFAAGEFLVGIPFPTCLTLAYDDIVQGEASDVELALRLLRRMEDEQPDSSTTETLNLQPYFQSLPTRDQHFHAPPDFWTDQEIEALEFPPIVEKAKQRKLDIQQLAQSEQVDAEQLQFAAWLVKSRGFTLLKPVLLEPASLSDDDTAEDDTQSTSTNENPEGTIMSKTVLMPYLDMINHASADQANAVLQVIETKAEDESFYGLQAIKPISKGSEITLCYGTGQESTVELLSNYGFIVPCNNPNDSILMKEWNNDSSFWSTSVEEDEEELNTLLNGDAVDSVRKTILEFRIRLKSAPKVLASISG